MKYTLSEKIAAAKEIVNLFKFERFVFLIASIISFLFLIFLSFYAIYHDRITWRLFLSLFFPTGGILVSAKNILGMYSKCLQFLKDELK